jgi:molybdate transport system substrate-binding protein
VILAHREWMDWLDARGHLKAQFPPVHLLGNRLVLIAPAGTAPMDRVDRAALLQRLGRGRLAMGHRTAVPAGVYARAWLEGLGAWTDVQPLLAETANVRAALALVALGESPLGIVYTSDALAEPAVQVLHRVPQNAHPEILYPAAALSPAGQNALGLLQSAPRRAVFVKHGFTRPKGGT